MKASKDERRRILRVVLKDLDYRFITVDLVLEVGVIMKVVMKLDYVIGFYIRIRIVWFRNSISSKIRVQSSRKRVYKCTTYGYESRMNRKVVRAVLYLCLIPKMRMVRFY